MRRRWCYVLGADGRTPEPVEAEEWAAWFEDADAVRIVGQTRVGEAEVSTVFIGVDYRFGRGGPPLVFETYIFGGPLDGRGGRWSTWEQAETGHADCVLLAATAAGLPAPAIVWPQRG